MYKWYALKRILRGIIIYALLIFIFSLLFNQINETTTRSQLLEQVQLEAQGLKNMKQEQMLAWRENRLKELYSIYRLDKPLWNVCGLMRQEYSHFSLESQQK